MNKIRGRKKLERVDEAKEPANAFHEWEVQDGRA